MPYPYREMETVQHVFASQREVDWANARFSFRDWWRVGRTQAFDGRYMNEMIEALRLPKPPLVRWWEVEAANLPE